MLFNSKATNVVLCNDDKRLEHYHVLSKRCVFSILRIEDDYFLYYCNDLNVRRLVAFFLLHTMGLFMPFGISDVPIFGTFVFIKISYLFIQVVVNVVLSFRSYSR